MNNVSKRKSVLFPPEMNIKICFASFPPRIDLHRRRVYPASVLLGPVIHQQSSIIGGQHNGVWSVRTGMTMGWAVDRDRTGQEHNSMPAAFGVTNGSHFRSRGPRGIAGIAHGSQISESFVMRSCNFKPPPSQ